MLGISVRPADRPYRTPGGSGDASISGKYLERRGRAARHLDRRFCRFRPVPPSLDYSPIVTGPGKFTVRRLAVGVQHANTALYLDRAGQLFIDVENALKSLGSWGNQVNTAATTFSSELEPIQISYGTQGFSLVHEFPRSVLDAESLVGPTWRAVSRRLEVSDKVSRVGVRLQFRWPTADVEGAKELLRKSGLTTPPRPWRDIFGENDLTEIISVSHEGVFRRRFQISVGSPQHAVGSVPRSLLNDSALGHLASGVDVDIDLALDARGEAELSVDHRELTSKLRVSWKDATRFAALVGRQLEAAEDGLVGL